MAPPPEVARRSVLVAGTVTGTALATGLPAGPGSATGSAHAASGDGPAYALVAEPADDGTQGIAVAETATGTAVVRSLAPLQIMVRIGDTPAETSTGYTSLEITETGAEASGVVSTPAGGRYRFDDRYTLDGAALTLDRTVTVEHAVDLKETCFNSRFALGIADGAAELADYDVLYPGMWYGDSTGLPEGAIGSDPEDTYFYVKETRLTLPFVLLPQRDGGRTVTLGRIGDPPATGRDGVVQENARTWWINEGIRYAGLGVQRTPEPQLACVYPAFEGEKAYGSDSWVRRSHPVVEGFSHQYTLLLRLGVHEGRPSAGRENWRAYWDHFAPPPGGGSAEPVHAAGVALLGRLTRDYNGHPGLPFSCQLPHGRPDAISYVMGFIGQQAPAGYQMLRAGLLSGDAELAAKGRSVIDFWVTESPLDNGLPRLWADGDELRWREWYPVFIRVAADGMDGVLDAARLMRRRGEPVRAWERYLTTFGDFLVDNQSEDGSFPRAYGWDGTIESPEKTNTSHPIRFLAHLHLCTGKERYLRAALRAGRFHREQTRGTFRFIGGTADNPNVVDKEAGGMAPHAALAPYDVTQDDGWLADAREAADFTETWILARGWPVATERAAYREDGPLGLSLIAAGHSGMDNWITYEGANFYRLHLFTGDEHYREVARLLTGTAHRTTQYPGNDLGYGEDGRCEEAISLTDMTYSGVGTWPPWVTVAQVEPLSQLQDIFGEMDIETIEDRLGAEQRRERNRRAGQRP
ncbi:hypothetical protein [Streptomyces triticirhizae]|uniref:hypothetical protein n=1 Tax=Streptomyces triticirhizae TaxID=2483353 RepID=UPI0013155126|nr:hypothetical protein [Streptomyces triticirhizae]